MVKFIRVTQFLARRSGGKFQQRIKLHSCGYTRYIHLYVCALAVSETNLSRLTSWGTSGAETRDV